MRTCAHAHTRTWPRTCTDAQGATNAHAQNARKGRTGHTEHARRTHARTGRCARARTCARRAHARTHARAHARVCACARLVCALRARVSRASHMCVPCIPCACTRNTCSVLQQLPGRSAVNALSLEFVQKPRDLFNVRRPVAPCSIAHRNAPIMQHIADPSRRTCRDITRTVHNLGDEPRSSSRAELVAHTASCRSWVTLSRGELPSRQDSSYTTRGRLSRAVSSAVIVIIAKTPTVRPWPALRFSPHDLGRDMRGLKLNP